MKGDTAVCASPECDNKFVRDKHNTQKFSYCSRRCKSRVYYLRHRDRLIARERKKREKTNQKFERVCAWRECDNKFTTKYSQQWTCSPPCYQRWKSRHTPTKLICANPECDNEFETTRPDNDLYCCKDCRRIATRLNNRSDVPCVKDNCITEKVEGTDYCRKHQAFTPEFQEKIFKIMNDAGLEPLEPYVDSMQRWKCRHSCGEIVYPPYARIQQGNGGCMSCVTTGLDPNEPLIMYLGYMQHGTENEKGKIGLSCDLERRIGEHKQDFEDFEVVDVICFDDGFLAVEVEKQMINFLKENRTVPYKREFFYTTDWKPETVKEFLEVAGISNML